MKAEITFEGQLSAFGDMVKGTSVEILLGSVYQGKQGKSAYEYAKEGGYEGTEEEFSKMIASKNQITFEVTGTIN